MSYQDFYDILQNIEIQIPLKICVGQAEVLTELKFFFYLKTIIFFKSSMVVKVLFKKRKLPIVTHLFAKSKHPKVCNYFSSHYYIDRSDLLNTCVKISINHFV